MIWIFSLIANRQGSSRVQGRSALGTRRWQTSQRWGTSSCTGNRNRFLDIFISSFAGGGGVRYIVISTLFKNMDINIEKGVHKYICKTLKVKLTPNYVGSQRPFGASPKNVNFCSWGLPLASLTNIAHKWSYIEKGCGCTHIWVSMLFLQTWPLILRMELVLPSSTVCPASGWFEFNIYRRQKQTSKYRIPNRKFSLLTF